MTIDFQRQRASFPSHTGGPQSIELTFVFPSAIHKAEAAINGFNIGYTRGDHHLLRTEVDANVVLVSLNAVRVRVTFSLRDSSGNFDDPYNGYVDVMVIVNRA
ncbi:MAG: hypothetical protein H6710_13385 [Myxococcales bacterium]|nr:hypothetical protein [Myxococcales bacterium]MCB9705402.1 hypothetical protein [Myxococcales bacterium]